MIGYSLPHYPLITQLLRQNYSILLSNFNKGLIGYLKFNSFLYTSSSVEIEDSIREFEQKNVTAIILDLRNNAGGVLEEAVEVVETPNIVGVASANADFSTLVTAVGAAGLVETLSGEGPFTVFAPTNAAFAKLPAGTVETLLKPESKDKLTAVLTYHVVAGKFEAAAVIEAINANNGKFEVTTVQGGKITLSLVDGKVVLTDANGGTATVAIAAGNLSADVNSTVGTPGYVTAKFTVTLVAPSVAGTYEARVITTRPSTGPSVAWTVTVKAADLTPSASTTTSRSFRRSSTSGCAF